VCRLNRSLYGLKQAPRVWFSRFASHLLHLGFTKAKSDTSLFVYHHGADMAYLLLYVDDIVLTASSPALLRQIIGALQQEFSMKDLGTLHHFLGMHVQHLGSTLFLSQQQYMIEILERLVWPIASLVQLQWILIQSCLLMVLLSRLRVLQIFGVSPVLFSGLLSPDQIFPMLFSKFAFICMIPGRHILLL